MKNPIENILKDQNLFFEEIQNKFKQEFKKIFLDIPSLEYVQWQQYTPAYNDGEPCSFTVATPEFFFGIESDGKCWYALNEENLSKQEIEYIKKFSKDFQEISVILERTFGDNKQVTIFKDGKIEIEDYYDEY